MKAGGVKAGGVTRLPSLQMLRAVAALLVVLFHTQTILGARGVAVFGGIFGNADRGVDLFFVLSGFVVTYVHARDWGHPRRLGRYVFNRVSRIYPSVLIVSALAVAAYLLGDRADKLEAWTIVAGVLLLPQDGPLLVGVTWTLKHEMVFYLVFAWTIADRRLLALPILWQAAVLACALAGLRLSGWARYGLGPTNLEFGLGIASALLVMHRAALPARAGPAVPAASLLLGTAMFVAGTLVELVWHRRLPVPDLAAYGLASALIVGAAALLDLSGRLRAPRMLVRLGDASYAIYLLHFAVVTQICGVLLRLGVTQGAWLGLSAAAGGVLAGMGFHRWVDRPIQQSLRRLRPA